MFKSLPIPAFAYPLLLAFVLSLVLLPLLHFPVLGLTSHQFWGLYFWGTVAASTLVLIIGLLAGNKSKPPTTLNSLALPAALCVSGLGCLAGLLLLLAVGLWLYSWSKHQARLEAARRLARPYAPSADLLQARRGGQWNACSREVA